MDPSLVLDLIIVATIVFAIVRGWSHRSIRETFGLLGLFVGLFAAVALVGPVASLITALSSIDVNIARLIALGTIVGVISIAGAVIGIRLSRKLILGGPRRLDAAGGAVLGGMRSVLVVTLSLYAVVALSARGAPGFVQIVDDSYTGDVFAEPSAPFVVFYDSILNRSSDLQALTLWVRQRSTLRERIPTDRLDFKGTDEKLLAALEGERQMLAGINEERAERGLDPLQWCDECADVARRHSKDMYRNGYFSHVAPDGTDPFERMRRAGIPYDSAGENLAIAPTVQEAHDGLMRSPDHRENILRREFDEVGIGIYRGPYGFMCTQVFRAKL
ncbi:MAG: CvpA family protein [Actinomycetota bacterium]